MSNLGWLAQSTIRNTKDKAINVNCSESVNKLRSIIKKETKTQKSNERHKAGLQLKFKTNLDKKKKIMKKKKKEGLTLLEKQQLIMEKKAAIYDQLSKLIR